MKNKTSLLLVAIIAITMASCSSKNSEKDTLAIDNVRLAYNAALNAHNVQALDSLIDVDAIWSIPGAPVIVGKDSIVAAYANAFFTDHSALEVKSGDLQMSGDWAILTAEFSRSDTLMMDTVSIVNQVSGHNLLAFKKQADGTWKIARDIWNEPCGNPCCKMGDKPCSKMGEKMGEMKCSKMVEKPCDKK